MSNSNDLDPKKSRWSAVLYVGAFVALIIVFILFSVTVMQQRGQDQPAVGAGNASPLSAETLNEQQEATPVATPQPTTPASPPPATHSSPQPEVLGAQTNTAPTPYVPPACTKTVLPYKTVIIRVKIGSNEKSTEGKDGYIQRCSADSKGVKPSDVMVPAVDRILYLPLNLL